MVWRYVSRGPLPCSREHTPTDRGRLLSKNTLGMSRVHEIRAVARTFEICGEFVGATVFGSGHINDTYCAVFHQAGVPVRFILQRINHHIFKNPVALMENIQRVTSHLAAQ